MFIYIFVIESIQDNRADRLAEDGILANAANVEKLKLKENVLGRNLSPSLQGKWNPDIIVGRHRI